MALPFIAAALGLAEFVPTIAKLLKGDKAQDVAKEVVVAAKRLTGKNEVEECVEAFRTSPELVLAFKKEVLRIQVQEQQLYLKDRQDARSRDVALLQTGKHNVRADIMVVSAALGLIFCLYSLSSYSDNLPGEAVGIISTIAGIFGACLKDAYAFEFGSSRGSKEKDNAVAVL